MSPQEYLEYLRKRYKVYGYLKFSLKDCKDTLNLSKLSDELLEEIFEDETLYFDYTKNNGVIPAPIQKEYESVIYYAQRVMEFFTMFKELKGL